MNYANENERNEFNAFFQDANPVKQTKSSAALARFLSDMGLGSAKMDDDYSLRLAEMRALLEPSRTVGFKRLTDTAVLPTKAHPTDSGWDLFADETVIIEPGQTVVVKTGIAVVLPAGYEATVRPRSGITSRTDLRVQLGTIDNTFRGNIGIIVDNTSRDTSLGNGFYMSIDGGVSELGGEGISAETYAIRRGDKLAQIVVSPVATFACVEVFDIDETARGNKGFGSSGVRNHKGDE